MTGHATSTRDRLIDAAGQLIWAGSFHASGVDEICRRADVRKGSFYHFFPSKIDLAIEALRSNWRSVRETVFDPIFDDEPSGMQRLLALVDAVDRHQRSAFEGGGVYLGCPFGSVGQEMAHQDPRLQAVVDEIFEGHIDYFERALRESVDHGQSEPGDLRRRARGLLALMEGALLVAKVGNRPGYFTEVLRAAPALAAHEPPDAQGDAAH